MIQFIKLSDAGFLAVTPECPALTGEAATVAALDWVSTLIRVMHRCAETYRAVHFAHFMAKRKSGQNLHSKESEGKACSTVLLRYP